MFGYTSNETIDEKTQIQFMDEKKKMVMANGGRDIAIVACRAPCLF